MKPAKKQPADNAIARFLKSQPGYYTNPFGVQSDLLEDGAFNMTAARTLSTGRCIFKRVVR